MEKKCFVVYTVIVIHIVFFFSSPEKTFAQQYRTDTSTSVIVGNPVIQTSTGSNNDCNGTYNFNQNKTPDYTKFWPDYTPTNFGDQNCEFVQTKLAQAKDNTYSFLKKIDPAHAYIWFAVIIPGESSWDPNNYAPPTGIQATLDASGAWGLVQMGTGKNGQYDHGNVFWQTQLSNAVAYNTILIQNNNGFTYWHTAQAYWHSH